MAGPTFWDSQEAAQKTVGELRTAQGTFKPLDELERVFIIERRGRRAIEHARVRGDRRGGFAPPRPG